MGRGKRRRDTTARSLPSAASISPTGSIDVVPLAPGQTAIEPGHIRLYHYTDGSPATLAREGLLLTHAKGHTYGEPDLIWASAEMPNPSIKCFIEFHIPIDDPGIAVGVPSRNDTPESYVARGGNLALCRDISPDEFIAIHEPWHLHYRYFVDEKLDPAEYQWIHDEAEKFPDEERALRLFEEELSKQR